ncbi:M48 family metallopeptidase [Actinocatenispora sera]|uniref:M48 family metallopeptidase n=1 Tax=Actinocatenispora sera TaxID=390989 RepID=UPI0034039F7A
MHERLCRAEVARPSRDAAWVFTYVLAGCVHAVTVAVAVLGIWLCLTGRLVLVPLGLLALAIVVLLRPRLGKIDPDVELLDRDEAPQLYALCDAVADAIGARHIAQIGLDPDFNAYYTVAGIRQRPTMVLGAPLWTVLDRQGRVALLGHELGHGANGDNRQGVFVGGALRALARWYELVRPGRDSVFAARGNPLGMIAGLLLLIPQAIVGGALYCVIVAFALVSLRVGQRAEYLADAMAVRAGGRSAARALLETFLVTGTLLRAGRLVPRNAPAGESYAAIVAHAAELPATEKDRLVRQGRMRQHRVDSSHPPTAMRLDHVGSRPDEPARVVLDAGQAAAIDAELAAPLARLERQFRDIVREYQV